MQLVLSVTSVTKLSYTLQLCQKRFLSNWILVQNRQMNFGVNLLSLFKLDHFVEVGK